MFLTTRRPAPILLSAVSLGACAINPAKALSCAGLANSFGATVDV